MRGCSGAEQGEKGKEKPAEMAGFLHASAV
jgi:hypothetical protein